MQQIINFIQKYRYFILFLLLEFLALFFTIQNHSYHRSKFINSANAVTGGLYKKTNSINEFVNLKEENQKLSEENAYLKNLLALNKLKADSSQIIEVDSTKYFQRYIYISGKIFNNNYSKKNNFLTINKGTINGITPEMGVVNSKGIIGITKSVSKHYATVMSILNPYSKINAKLKKNNHFGTLSWNGKDYNTLQLEDIPRQSNIKVGDTVLTGGRSTIFPEGIPIGVIKDFKTNNHSFDIVNIQLFNDMSSLSNINIIKNLHKEEIIQLEKKNNE